MMAECLDLAHFVPYSQARRKSPDYFRDWSVVLSGLFLSEPTLGRSYPSKPDEAIDLDDASGDPCSCTFLLSLITSISDSKDRVKYCLSDRSVSPLFQLLFDPGTDPLVREWITLDIHATIIRHNVDPKEQTESNLTAYTALLLLDGSQDTRAAAVSILTSLMTPNYPAFNATLMHIATRVVTDGSALVRRALVHCLAKYVKVRGRSSTVERPFEYFLRNPLEQPSQDPNTSQIIHLLRNDPSPDVRHAAQEIELGHEVDDWDSKYIHLLAHLSLFTNEKVCKGPARYRDDLFEVNEIDHLETLKNDGHQISRSMRNWMSAL
jgi:hypothetical protein